MKIDIINTAEEEAPKKEGLSINENDSPLSLSSPFINPYIKSGSGSGGSYNYAGNVTASTGKGKTAAERNNNPFNIKFGKFASGYGATKENKAALDGGSFATFPNVEAGMTAARDLLRGKNYRDLTVDQAMRRWSNNGYGGDLYPQISTRKISDLNDNELKDLQRRQVVREDRNYAKKLGFLNDKEMKGNLPVYRYGANLRKLDNGGYLSNIDPDTDESVNAKKGIGTDMLSMGLGVLGQGVEMLDNNPKKVNKGAVTTGGVLKGAAAGAQIGSIIPGWGTAVGAVVGGAVGGLTANGKAKKRQRLIDQQTALDQGNFNFTQEQRSANLYRQASPYVMKYGGDIPKTVYKDAKGRVLATGEATPVYPETEFMPVKAAKPILRLINAIQIASDTNKELEAKADTIKKKRKIITEVASTKPSYKYGANAIEPEYEAEKGEVIQGDAMLEDGKQIASGLHLVGGNTHENGGTKGVGGDRVFTNSISFKGETPAKTAHKIGLKLKKFESMLGSNDTMKKRTATVMTEKLNKELDVIFQTQEDFKQGLPVFKYGGNLPKFADGGDIESKRKAIKRRINTINSYLKSDPKRQALGNYDAKDDLKKELKTLQGQLNNKTIWNKTPYNPLNKKTNISGKEYPLLDPLYDGSKLKEVTIKPEKRQVTTSPPVKNNSVASSGSNSKTSTATPTVSTQAATTKPLNLPNGFDKSIRNDNRVGNLRGGTTMGSVDPIARTGVNQTDEVGKIRNRGLNIDPALATDVGLSALGYMSSANAINKMQTNVPVSLTHSPYYNYTDRSRGAREGIQTMAGSVLKDPNVNAAQKQAIFARASQGINDVNAQEANNRFGYDEQFANMQFRIDAQNNAVVNNATQQRIENENNKLMMKSGNFNSLVGNIGTAIGAQNERKVNDKRFKLLADTYGRNYGTNFGITR